MKTLFACVVAVVAGVAGARYVGRALDYLLAAQLYDVLGELPLTALTTLIGLVTAAFAWAIAEHALRSREPSRAKELEALLRSRIYRITAGAAVLFTLYGRAWRSPARRTPGRRAGASTRRSVTRCMRTRAAPICPSRSRDRATPIRTPATSRSAPICRSVGAT